MTTVAKTQYQNSSAYLAVSNSDWVDTINHFNGFPNRVYYDGNEYVIQSSLLAGGVRYIVLTTSTSVNWIAGLEIELGQE